MQVIQYIKRTINHSSDRVKTHVYFHKRHGNRPNPNSIRGVINKHNPKRASLLLLPSLTVVAMFMVVAVSTVKYASAEDLTETENLDFSITSEKSLGVTLSGASVNLSINPTAEGQFGRKSMWIDVSTNNKTGYTLSVKANETATLTRSAKVNGTSYTINPLTANVTCSTESDTACSGWSTNNVWGYRSDGWETSNVYKAMTTSLVPIKTTTAPANESKTTVYFASQLNNAIPTGDYSGVSLDFVAVTNEVPPSFTVNYGSGFAGVIVKSDSPEGDTVATITESGKDIGSSVTAGTKYYLLPLYNTQKTFNSVSMSGCTATTGDYGYYYCEATGDDGITFANASDLGTTSSTNMQNLAIANCPAYPTAVKDNRSGNEVYYIQRLADGNCWMLENLRLGGTSNIALSASDSHISGSYTLNAGITSGFTGYDVQHINVAYKTTTVTGYGPGRNYVGVYYNYCAASAGTICTSGNTTDTSYDVCPAGWKMPKGDTSAGSYKALYDAYNSNATNFKTALSTPLSGYFYSSSQSNQGSDGRFWSSTYYDGYGMRFLLVNTSSVDPQNYGTRGYGNSVRCMFADSGIASEWLSSNNFTIASQYLEYFSRSDSEDRVLVATKAGAVIVNGATFELEAGDLITATPGTYTGLGVDKRLLIAASSTYVVNGTSLDARVGNIIVGLPGGAELWNDAANVNIE